MDALPQVLMPRETTHPPTSGAWSLRGGRGPGQAGALSPPASPPRRRILSPARGRLSRRWHPTSAAPRDPNPAPRARIPFIQAGDPLGRGRRVCSVRSDHVGQRRAVAPGRGHLPRASRRAPAACGAGTEGRARRGARAALRRPPAGEPRHPARRPPRPEPRPRGTCGRCPAPPGPRPPAPPPGLCSRWPPRCSWAGDVRLAIYFSYGKCH